MASKKSSSKGQAWFCTTGLPSDVKIEVDDMTFHLHKFPMMSKSRKLHELITEQEKNPTSRITRIQTASESNQYSENDCEEEEIQEEGEEDEEEECLVMLPDFPGGSESFETAAKFCYGVKIDISASSVAALRCAGEYLEMTEEHSEKNLISKTERFLTHSVLKNIKHSIKTLTSCEGLLPLAENLGIVLRCIDAIVSKAASSDPSLFGWPVNDGAANNEGGAESERRKVANATRGRNGMDSWLNELGQLSLPFFKRLIFAMKVLNLNRVIIESCLIYYAKKYIPGISRTNRKLLSSSNVPSANDLRELLETVIANLPVEKSSNSTLNSTRFLFGLLKTANMLNISEACRASLEKKIGSQLEQATLDDMLIPSYSYLDETLYDVDCVERILRYFLQELENRSVNRIEGEERSTALLLVGKLIDGYLWEIASDANLKQEKFFELNFALPDRARIFDDGLYRAVDVYLKAHPWIPEADREKICAVLDFQKLTLEACTHAAQNERLPLRAVVQVLFLEQLQLRQAITGGLLEADASLTEADHGIGEEEEAVVVARTQEGGSTWRAAVRENQVLRLDMDSIRTRVHELERGCSTLRTAIQKIDRIEPVGHVETVGWRNSLVRKFGCKFKTQVCDSHEPAANEARKGRIHRHHQ